jgi:hypothetical protein
VAIVSFVTGALLLVVIIGVAGPGAVPLILVPLVLAIIAASEWGAIATARRNGTNRQP